MKILSALILALALSGCATCEQHPYMCGFATAVVVGSIAATLASNDCSHHANSSPALYPYEPAPPIVLH